MKIRLAASSPIGQNTHILWENFDETDCYFLRWNVEFTNNT